MRIPIIPRPVPSFSCSALPCGQIEVFFFPCFSLRIAVPIDGLVDLVSVLKTLAFTRCYSNQKEGTPLSPIFFFFEMRNLGFSVGSGCFLEGFQTSE